MLRISLLLSCLLALPLAAVAQPPSGGALSFGALSLDAEVGGALFRKTWVGGPASTRASDGLGPRYNARSCERCHPRGGAGHPLEAERPNQAAPALVLFFPQGSETYGAQLQTFALAGLPAEGRLSLRYEESETRLDDGEIVSLRRPHYDVEALAHGPLPPGLRLSPRLAPALAGAALLAEMSVPGSPRQGGGTIEEAGAKQGPARNSLSGQRSERGGRLGWAATGDSLARQVALALHLDLGLGNPLFPDPNGDCGPAQPGCGVDARQAEGAVELDAGPTTGDAANVRLVSMGSAARNATQPAAGDIELEAGQAVLDALLDYLAELRPAAHLPPQPGQDAYEGQTVFHEIGCTGCHRSDLEAAPGLRPYSDLLLHDLGEGLADRNVAGAVLPTRWRTAPLWGLAERQGRWLHDGRARSLDEAILWHGGEAEDAVRRYRALPARTRTMLKSFISGL